MRKRGSPLESSSSTEGRHVVGRLGRPHGLEGFLGLYIDDADLDRLSPGTLLRAGDRDLTVSALRRGDKGPQIRFEEIDDRTSAEELRGFEVSMAQRRPLADGEHWPADLIGLRVIPEGGEVVGVEHGPSQARLVIVRHGRRFEVPFVEDLVPRVDIEEGLIEVVELPGLIEPGPE